MGNERDSGDMPTIEHASTAQLSGRWLSAIRLAAGILIVLALVYYGLSFREYLAYLRTGFVGAECLACDYETGTIRLNVVPNSPAAQEGITRGDMLVKVDEVASADLNPPAHDYDEPVPYGHPGTRVSLTVRDEAGSVKKHTVVREEGWGDLASVGPRILGASGPVSVGLALGSDIMIFVGFAITGLFMIWRKPQSWLVTLAGISLILLGNYAARAPLFLPGTTISGLYISVALTTFYILFFVFPDGKLVPRWALIPICTYAVWQLVYMLAVRPMVGTRSPFRVIDIAFWVVAIVVQVHRYRRLSTPLQRQQTKWVLLGLAVCVAERFIFVLLGAAVPALNISALPTPISYLYFSIGDTLGRLALLILPLTFMIGILRYRLWDVDFIINRSVVYTLLTVALGIVFATGSWGLQTLIEMIFNSQQSTLAVVASTMLVVGAFNPIRDGLRTFVDRRLYGIKVNYQAANISPPGMVASLALKTGLDSYEGLEPIGRGGMAEVFKAHHPKLNRTVAIKVMPYRTARDPEFRHRFEREARTIAILRHPNIVQLFDFSETEETCYMVMEYISGPSLAQYLHDVGPLPIDEVRDLLLDIASALDYAHEQGIIHRDIKPSNILLQPATSPGRLKQHPILTDFGIAKIVGGATALTASSVVGTFEYIAPEQIRDSAEVDARTDVYALGVMTYQMVTGKLPFPSSNTAALLIAHLQQPAPDPRIIMPDLAPTVAQAIVRAMAKTPEDRFRTAGEFAAALSDQEAE